MDLDETLFDFSASQRRAFIATMAAYGVEWHDNLLFHFNTIQGELWRKFEAGEITKDQIFATRFNLFFKDCNHLADGIGANALFLDYLALSPELLPGAEALCEYLHQRYPLAIVTNGDTHTQKKRLAASPLRNYFRHMIISDDVGVGKPHPDIFWHALERTGIDRQAKVLMIGDNLKADIAGAQACGFDTCWIKGKSSLETDKSISPTYQVSTLPEIHSFL